MGKKRGLVDIDTGVEVDDALIEVLETTELDSTLLLQPDGVGGVQWNPSTGEIKYRKAYTCEDNGAGASKLSWGNGATNQNQGAVITEDGTAVDIGISTQNSATNSSFDFYVNNILQAQITHNGTSSVNTINVPVTSGDYINLRRTSAGGGGIVTATIEVEMSFNINGALKGDQGEQGLPGVNSFLFGTGAPVNPAPTQGAYIDISNGDYYFESGGVWTFQYNSTGPQGIQGIAGINGTDGASVLNGTVNPSTEGVDGDFYINTISNQIFGPKTGGTWGSGTDLIGADGVDGIVQFRFGSGTPLAGLGNDGDFYIDTVTIDYYLKISGSWVFQANASGSSGYGLLSMKNVSSLATSANITTFSSVPFDLGPNWIDSPFQKNSNTVFEVLESGRYKIDFEAEVNATTGNYRYLAELRVLKNGTDSLGPISNGYIRSTSGHNETTIFLHNEFNFAANDTIELQIRRQSTVSGNGALTPNRTRIIITKMAN